jgi:myosin heavy subunit
MSVKKAWGELTRCGGSEDSPVPYYIELTDNPSFFGRVASPQAGGKIEFSHSSQHVIECPFISSTHFSIEYEINDSGEIIGYKINDYSRNGTFLDGILIGSVHQVLSNGAEITLRYKDKIKIAYRFNTILMPHVAKVRKPEMDTATAALAQQITLLQEEIGKLESKCTTQEEQCRSLQADLDAASRKNRQSEKLVEQQAKELSEAKERISMVEANASAVQARVIRLENDLEEAELSIKDQRSKLGSLQDKLKSKNEQLESNQKVISNGNQALTKEQTIRIHTEALLQEITEQFEQSKEKNSRLSAANQALQAMIIEQENQKSKLQEHIGTHRAMIIAIQQRVKEQLRLNHTVESKLHDLLQLFGQVDSTTKQLIQVTDKHLLRDIDEFLAAPEFIAINYNSSNEGNRSAWADQEDSSNRSEKGILSASLPRSNNVVAPSGTLSGHFSNTMPAAPLGSEDSSISKRGFNFTQVPFSGVYEEDEAATFAPSIALQEAIMEVDNDNEEDEEEPSTIEQMKRSGGKAMNGTDVEDEGTCDETRNKDDHMVAADGLETQIPVTDEAENNQSHSPSALKSESIKGIFLSQESNIRKSGSPPSKSDIVFGEQNKFAISESEEEILYTSIPVPPQGLVRKRSEMDGSNEDSESHFHDQEDGPRVKRHRVEETTFALESHGIDDLGFISPPKSFDISRDLLLSRDEYNMDFNDQSMKIREEDCQRPMDTSMNTVSRLEVSASQDN